MRRVLLYSPDVEGHPRVYCRVIADALSKADCELHVAIGFALRSVLRRSPDLLPLERRQGLYLHDSAAWSSEESGHLRAEEILRLQKDTKADVTLFIEGDKSGAELIRIAEGEAPPLAGRNLAIFANTAEWYPGEDSYSGERRKLLAPKLRTTLGNVKRRLFDRRKSARHFFESTLLGSGVLDELLVKDERLADWHGPPVYWMPEISRPAMEEAANHEAAEFSRREEELRTFIQANAARKPLLFFGDAAAYKGYDLWLELLAGEESLCGIHAGRLSDAEEAARMSPRIGELRSRLVESCRLLETREYVSSRRLKELYFGAVPLYVTTHRLALSSATVIQALELGKPVLVPDRGLLGYRVRTHGLGGAYAYGDLKDLMRKASDLWSSDLSRFDRPAKEFWKRFSDDAIRKFFTARLLGA